MSRLDAEASWNFSMLVCVTDQAIVSQLSQIPGSRRALHPANEVIVRILGFRPLFHCLFTV
jgi:hypothetical protein